VLKLLLKEANLLLERLIFEGLAGADLFKRFDTF